MKLTIILLRFVYLPIAGLFILPVSYWFAAGFISEYGPEAPDIIFPLWLIPAAVFLLGVVIQCWRKYFWLGIGITVFSFVLFFTDIIPYRAIDLF
ncbi:hypothetical protein KQ939_15050 [Planococcus sp. CP5-4]|uniref:hypothetical protein n=1 Tax=unclassified Planococcus (in: firmicutes) TaxID=2662419 RepID=UPI001C2189B3|nr:MULTISPECIES: hypothetical protein [unclassified Planococcus (in: firmicutes)]MBU9674302.1 hypothetical protein [Planococcus sp. CP5-4_YE]MBV0909111.1 hypothetical protein [Planococcus sp. CP5-4_UN]MBW6064993.1 hypothetical protein [Planococcus sp. CP5-4]